MKVNTNYFDRNYVSVNPSRRSIEAAELIDKNNPIYRKIFDQEKLPSFYTLDLSFGKSIRLHNLWDKMAYQTALSINIGINNVLNNQNIKSGGYEQLRYDFSNNNPDKFPTKYTYAMGRTFFANISLKF
jgi:outer membrane receptor protein involved in Fe transport